VCYGWAEPAQGARQTGARISKTPKRSGCAETIVATLIFTHGTKYIIKNLKRFRDADDRFTNQTNEEASFHSEASHSSAKKKAQG